MSDAAAAAARGAELIAAQLREAVAARGRASLAVSGGRTPQRMLEILAGALPWDRVDLFQVDERVAPAGHPDRNSVQIERAFGAQIAGAPRSFHWMPVESADLGAAASSYERELEAAAGRPPALDAVHLGLGADGHTASLFPGSPLLEETRAAVAVTPEPHAGRRRMTLTLPALARARLAVFLVTGADKRAVLSRLLRGDRGVVASRVRSGRIVVVADLEAAPAIP